MEILQIEGCMFEPWLVLKQFYPPTERFAGYSDEPGTRPSVRPYVRP